jgi:PEP-CTERM motif
MRKLKTIAMREWIRRALAGPGVLALMASSAALADFVPITQPDAAYLSATTLLPVSAPDFDVVSSLSDATETVTFDVDLVALTVPTSWTSWGSPPSTESAIPRVLWSNGFTSLAITLSAPAFTVGFEAQPNTSVPSILTATFLNSGSVVGSIPLTVDGNGGALLFAATTSTSPFNEVDLNSTDDFAIAQVRYAIAQVVPEPESLALMLLGGAVLVFRRSRRGLHAE